MITKSDYKLALVNLKTLWLKKHGKLDIKISTEDQFTIDQGVYVGELARDRYPNGFMPEVTNNIFNVEQTKANLDKDYIYEAGFQFEDLYVRIDILRNNHDGTYDIIEVKGSTKQKDEHIEDVSFQHYVCEKAGIKIKNNFVLLLNNTYYKDGDLDLDKLFIETPVELLSDNYIQDNIDVIRETIKSDKEPDMFLSYDKKSLFHIPKEEYFEKLPQDSIFNLSRGGKKSYRLYEEGITTIHSIDGSVKLSANQQNQVDATKSGSVRIDKAFISDWLSQLNSPVYYLDFECVNLAVPVFDCQKPYQQIPFQYSLHIDDSGLVHKEFIADGSHDPRREFIDKLIEDLGDEGVIVVYNQAFEKMILKQLCDVFPELSDKINKIISRIIDLYDIFKTFSYYDVRQCGSASIKKVLPCFSDLSYSELDINNGALASVMFYNAFFKDLDVDTSKVRADLSKYCEMDTYAMVEIVNKLRKLV